MASERGMGTRGAHLVGSVPLASAEEVFGAAGAALGRHLRRVPDGETGDRTNWIGWQFGVLATQPQLREVPPDPEHYAPLRQISLGSDAASGTLVFDNIGYADAAIASYRVFERLRNEGVLPPAVRFQVSLPTPLAPVTNFVVPSDRAAVEPPYEAALLRELDRIVAAVPAENLAIQWDVAVEFGILEGVWEAHFDDPFDGIVERLVRLAGRVPEGVELGFHLCYGDYGHQHFKEPEDAATLVRLANAVSARVTRSIAWIHLPVPRDRTDAAYFAPLSELALHPETELYLGLVHATDGESGARRRIAAAAAALPAFGVATECGLGRRSAATVPDLLELHAAVSAPVR